MSTRYGMSPAGHAASTASAVENHAHPASLARAPAKNARATNNDKQRLMGGPPGDGSFRPYPKGEPGVPEPAQWTNVRPEEVWDAGSSDASEIGMSRMTDRRSWVAVSTTAALLLVAGCSSPDRATHEGVGVNRAASAVAGDSTPPPVEPARRAARLRP